MRIHFRELTGIQTDDSFNESTATKFRRILRYFQIVKTVPSSREGTILSQTLEGADVDTTKLPWTHCIVVCGNRPLTAKVFMVAVDQVIINDWLNSFNSAFQMMFCSYYVHNIDYPVEIAATMEFLQ
ncbi:hypothetical protein QTP70_025868 [Hemibagrus guttatus]|uniref:Uncharacterized protein n=1 Tax=Hemibagrus guttatus TaxID=175788 RepID=A0AAE0UX18_9TELE|nr:hypothetical protein QTP70_025868 [Hemibagrus guttatus]